MWEGVGDQTELQHIDPHSIGHNHVSFPFSWAAQLGTWGPASLGASFLYHICHQLVWSLNCSIGGLRAPSAGCWLSLPHLVTNGSGLQTNWLPVFTKLNNNSTPTFLWASQFCTHSTCPRSRLTARSGHRSIYNRWIHAFPFNISTKWNAINLIHDVNLGHWFHFLQW